MRRLRHEALNREVVEVLAQPVQRGAAEDGLGDAVFLDEGRGGGRDVLAVEMNDLCAEVGGKLQARLQGTAALGASSFSLCTWTTKSSPSRPSASRAPRAMRSRAWELALMQTATFSVTDQCAPSCLLCT